VSRFHVEGVLETSQGEQPLSGLAWFEHLWGELPIPGESPVVSDRLQVQLDDGTDLAVIRSRRIDGGGTPTIEAFLIGADGQATPLGDESASIEITRHWQGHEGSWPIGWALRLDDLELSVMPVLDDQEHAFVAPTWSGLVQAEGRRGNRALSGMGTLQSSGTGLP
jgi:predicted secreted hydrolase